MAEKLTKQDYEALKGLDKKYLTQEQMDAIYEYESSEALMPSKKDMKWATAILNESNPQIQSIFQKNGDWAKALDIVNQEDAARRVMKAKGQYPYVREVSATPDDIVKKGGYKFNWRNAYENVKEEPLNANEEDAKKLQDFISSNMYGVNDDVKLQQIAYNLHMYNPNTMKWEEFIQSKQGDEFRNYLDDVRNAQTEKAVDDIWDGTDVTKINYPFLGPTDVPGSKGAMEFMLPVSKSYAREHYNDKDFSMTKPLLSDIAANVVMMGPAFAGKALPAKLARPAGKVLNKPLISTVYGNVAAPAITETSNAIYNDQSIPETIARTMEGTFVNVGTPFVLENLFSRLGRGLPIKEGGRSVQKLIDDAANDAGNTIHSINAGRPYPHMAKSEPLEFGMHTKDGTKYYSSNPAQSKKDWKNKIEFESVENMPYESIAENEMTRFKEGLPFLRGKAGKKDAAKIALRDQKASAPATNDLLLKKAEALRNEGNLASLSPADLRQLGYPDKESYVNWLTREFKNNAPEELTTYLTNAAGRPQFGRRAGPIMTVNHLLGTELFKKDKNAQDKEKSRIMRILQSRDY